MSKPKPNNQIVAGSGMSTAPQPWCPMILIVAANVTVLVAEKTPPKLSFICAFYSLS
nr:MULTISPECIES: hypothetical protein [unclassified Colwellia]